MTRNDSMDILINDLNKSVNGIDESNEVINNIAVKHPIINPVKSFYETSVNKFISNIDFNINSRHSDKSHVGSKSWSEINLDQMDKPPFNEVADNAINQMIVLIENMKSLQSKHKELFLTSKDEESITTLSDLTERGMSNKQYG